MQKTQYELPKGTVRNRVRPVFSEGLARVRADGKYGYIDGTGKLVIPAKYDRAEDFSGGVACIRSGNRYGYIDKSGAFILQAVYRGAHDFSEGLAAVMVSGEGRGNYEWVFINQEGEIVISGIEGYPGVFHEGMSLIFGEEEEYVINKTGKTILHLKEKKAVQEYERFKEGLLPVEFGKKCGFIDKTGKVVIPLIYDEVSEFSGGLAAGRRGRKWYLLNSGCLNCFYL